MYISMSDALTPREESHDSIEVALSPAWVAIHSSAFFSSRWRSSTPTLPPLTATLHCSDRRNRPLHSAVIPVPA